MHSVRKLSVLGFNSLLMLGNNQVFKSTENKPDYKQIDPEETFS